MTEASLNSKQPVNLDFADPTKFLTITFTVDENLETYKQIHDWMAGLAQVDSDEKYRELVTDGGDRMPLSTQTSSTDAGRPTKMTPDGAIFADAKLMVMTSRNISIMEINYQDIYPKSLSALEYNQNLTDVEYLTATCTFGYKIHTYTTL